MKYILSILLIIISINCFSQTFGFPSQLPGNNKPQITINQGTVGTTTGITWIISIADTTAANLLPYVKNQPGIVILVGGSEFWVRNQAHTKWVLISGGAVDNNQWFGIDAFATFKNGTLTTATQNLAIGQNSLKLNIAGIGNTGVGFNTLSNNNSDYNTATGYIALRQNLTGNYLTGTGAEVLLNNTTGYRNTADGYKNMTTLTIGHDNSNLGANGFQSLTSGISNTGAGSWSMLNASIASFNVSLGDSSNFANIAGHGNVDAGYQTGSSTGGDYNIRIGFRSGNHPLQMATPINSIAIGPYTYNTASNQIVIGDSAHTDLRLYGITPGSGNSTLKYDSVTKQVYWGSPQGNSANNGITDSSGRFILGGSLYKPTYINTQGYGLKIFSTATSANDTLFAVASSGANTSSTLTTIGQSISITNTGSLSSNYGFISSASGASENYAIRGIGSGGNGTGAWLTGSFYGVYVTSSASGTTPIYAETFFNGSNSGIPAAQLVSYLQNSSSQEHTILKLDRNGGVPGISDHPAGAIGYYVEVSDGSTQPTTLLTSRLSNAIAANYTSIFQISGVNNASSIDTLLGVQGTGELLPYKYGVGSFTTGTPAYYLAVTATGKIMEVAPGGGGGQTWQQTLTTGSTFSTDNTVDLDGNFFKMTQGGVEFLSVDPTAGAETIYLQAFNNTGLGNYSFSRFAGTNTAATATIGSEFNDGESTATFSQDAESSTGSMTFSTSWNSGAKQATFAISTESGVSDILVQSDNFYINDAATSGATNGWVFTLMDKTTGRGAWVVAPGGVGGSVNSVNVAGGTTGLTFSGGPVTTSGTITMAGTLGVANGGTNITSYTIGDLPYASGATTLSKLADVAAGSYLRSGGVSTAPVWSTLILPNSATVNQIVFASATNTYGASANLTFDGNIFTQTSSVSTGQNTTSAFVGTFNSLTSGTAHYYASSSITSGNILQIISTGTAKAANNEAFEIAVSGANATSGITVTGGRISVNNTNGTSGTNIALALDAAGANTANIDLDLGINGSSAGLMRVNGSSSGGVSITAAAAAGTWTLILPTGTAANNYDYLTIDPATNQSRWQAGFNPTNQTLTDGTSITWNVNSGGNARVTLGAAGRTLVITNAVAGYTYTVRIIQDGTGSRTITTWPTGTKWPNNGTSPTLTTTAAHYDIVSFFYDGTNFYGNYNFDYQ